MNSPLSNALLMSFNKGLKCSILSPIYRFEWETKPGEESPSKQKELVIYPKVTGKMTPSVVKGRKRDFNSKLAEWVKSPGVIVPLPSPPPSTLVSPSQVLQKKTCKAKCEERLLIIIRLIKNLFIEEKKKALPLEVVVMKTVSSYHQVITSSAVKHSIQRILKLTKESLMAIIRVKGKEWLKLNCEMDVNEMLLFLESSIKKDSKKNKIQGCLHTGTPAPSQLLCRGEQVAAMEQWLDQHLNTNMPGSMYVSGAPGTGKTATLTHLLETKVTKEYKSIFINCMVLKSSIAIYREVAKQLNPKKVAKTEKDALKTIESCVRSSKMMILLVLDEVDQLESKDQAVLYTVFEWPALAGSKLALVGIANSLDLTERVLPRLQVSAAYTPTLLHYPPYTKQQIMDILTARITEAQLQQRDQAQPVITTRAIAFLAGKIASLSGDLRKALDVARRALELAETLARKQTLLQATNPRAGAGASPGKSPRKGYLQPKVVAGVGQVDVPQIMKVINQVYGSQVTASLGTKGDGLPLKQKILVASLLLMVKKGRSKEVTLGKLADTYAKILKKRQLEPEHDTACVGKLIKLIIPALTKFNV